MIKKEIKRLNMDGFAKDTINFTQKITGRAVRPFREDGYYNMMTKYGTEKDSSEQYQYQVEPEVSDIELEQFYESNGLFAKIIDAPAEEAIKHGFEFVDLTDEDLKNFYLEGLDDLDWEETAITSLKWMRLFGGAIAVMMIDDGQELDQPLDWKHIKSIDDIVVYDRSVVVPDYASMYHYENQDPYRTRGSRLGRPERYMVSSRYGTFTVHETRCLIFRNGILPENTTDSIYRIWGIPEYIKIQRAIRDVEVSHGMAPKLLDRSIQAVYRMKDLAMQLAREGGEEAVLKRLQTIDMARGMLNSVVIDSDNEDYGFTSYSYTGVSEVINTTCNYLSAVSNIPQTILFGRSPAGMNSTGNSDLENYYNYVERIQKRVLKSNIRYLLAIMFQAGKHSGEVKEVPPIKIDFNSLWSLTENEQVALDMQKAQLESTKAQTANVYVGMQAIDPSEVRKKLAEDGDFDVETMLDEFTEEELEENNPANKQQQGGMGGMMGGMPGGEDPNGSMGDMMAMLGGAQEKPKEQPQQPKESRPIESLPEEQNKATKPKQVSENEPIKEDEDDGQDKIEAVGVLVIENGKILTGTRKMGKGIGTICGPGGHIERGEDAKTAARRETFEEFNIIPKDLMYLGRTEIGDGSLTPNIFLCTRYAGVPQCDGNEMDGLVWRDMNELYAFEDKLFKPFYNSLKLLEEKIGKGLYESKDSWK